MAGLTRYAVKSCTLTFNSVAYPAETAPFMKAETKDAVEVTALTDTVKQFIAGAVKETDEFTVTLFANGSSDLTVDTVPAALTLAIVLNNGVDSDVTASVSYNRAIITKVSPTELSATGDRKATYQVTFKPDGTSA